MWHVSWMLNSGIVSLPLQTVLELQKQKREHSVGTEPAPQLPATLGVSDI